MTVMIGSVLAAGLLFVAAPSSPPVATWLEMHEGEAEIGEARTLRFAEPARLLDRDGPVRARRREGGRAFRVEFTSSGPSRLLFEVDPSHRLEWRFIATPPLPLPLRDDARRRRARAGEELEETAAVFSPGSEAPRITATLLPPPRIEAESTPSRFARIPPELLALIAAGREGEDLSQLADLLASAEEIDRFRLALDLITRESYDEAVSELHEMLTRNPRSPLSPLLLFKIGDAEMLRAAKAEGEAKALLARRLPGDASARYAEAVGAYEAAGRGYRESQEKNPASPLADDALFGAAEALRGATRVGNETATVPTRNPQLLVSYLRIIHGMPGTPLLDNAHYGIGKSEEELGDALLAKAEEEGAREAYRNAVREYAGVAARPENSEAGAALWALAGLHDRNILVRDFAAAVREYEAYAAEPDRPRAPEARARAEYLRRNYL